MLDSDGGDLQKTLRVRCRIMSYTFDMHFWAKSRSYYTPAIF